jgi:hypothetical protein
MDLINGNRYQPQITTRAEEEDIVCTKLERQVSVVSSIDQLQHSGLEVVLVLEPARGDINLYNVKPTKQINRWLLVRRRRILEKRQCTLKVEIRSITVDECRGIGSIQWDGYQAIMRNRSWQIDGNSSNSEGRCLILSYSSTASGIWCCSRQRDQQQTR